MQDHRLLEVGQQQGEQVLVALVERWRVLATGDADTALGAIAGVDIRTEDMKHVHRLQEALVELRVLPVAVRHEFGQCDHLAIGQAYEGVEAVEMLVIGVRDLHGGADRGNAQTIHCLAGRTEDEGCVLGLKAVLQLIQEGCPGNVLQRPLIEVAEHSAELVERKYLCHV
ncbi:hypothetical protein D3C78_1281520 [compost metagenome]